MIIVSFGASRITNEWVADQAAARRLPLGFATSLAFTVWIHAITVLSC